MATDASLPATPAAEADLVRPGASAAELTAQLAAAKQAIADLCAQLAEATTQLASVTQVNAGLSDKLAEAAQAIAQLKHELLLLKHWRFGRHSERGAGELTGSLFAALESPGAPEVALAIEAAAEAPAPSAKKKGAHGRRTLPGHLPTRARRPCAFPRREGLRALAARRRSSSARKCRSNCRMHESIVGGYA